MGLLNACGIRSVVHLILGLPGEDKQQFISSAKYAASFRPFGLKLHMLHLMRGTAMGEQYLKAPWKMLSMEKYVEAVVDILERIPRDITIHRLTGDAPADSLIAPEWTRNKHNVLNAVRHEFALRKSFQGKLLCAEDSFTGEKSSQNAMPSRI